MFSEIHQLKQIGLKKAQVARKPLCQYIAGNLSSFQKMIMRSLFKQDPHSAIKP